MAQTPFEKALVDEGIVGTPLESLARSIYMQESTGGKNTKTSNAGAVGGMQILPGTFNEVLPGGNINDPYDNSRAGLRYIKKMNDLAGGDLTLTAAGYYGGPGGLNKAKEGVAVSDPRNPNAPTTLQYAKQVTARQNKSVPRETSPAESPAIKENIADLGQNYQAAYALMSMADEEPETTREIEAREAAEEQSAAQQFANMQKQLASIKPASPFADQGSQEPQNFKDGGEVEEEDEDDKSEARKAFDKYLKKATRERSALDVEFKTPPPQPMVVEGMGLQRGAPPSVQGRVGYDQDGFRMGASGVAVKTPQGVKYMPGMYDVGYKTPMAGGELDFNYARGMKTMPGMPTPQMANVRYVRKFEEGGDVAPVYDKKVSPEKKLANLLGLGPAYEASVQAPKDMGLSGDEGTEGDAVRHMVLMREVSKKYGPVGAKVLGYAHEFGPNMLSGQSSKDREMDLNNNALGLELTKQAGGDEELFKRLVAQALGDKKATYYRDEYNSSKFPVESGNMVSAKNMLKAMPKGEGVRKRAAGSPEEGEVSGSTFEEGGPENAKRMLKDVVRGATYYPYDLVGAPVDIINMGLKGVDYVTGSKLATEKPVGGSADLIDRSNKLGIAEKPTGSISEEAARIGSAFINPASGARATGRVLEKTGEIAAKGAEKAGLAATRAITKNPDITAAQMYDAMLSKQGPTTAAVRPKGGTVYVGAQNRNQPPLDVFDQDVINLSNSMDLKDPLNQSIVDFFDKKVRKYVQVQRGTPDDPIFNAYLKGTLEPASDRVKSIMKEAREGSAEAYKQGRNQYDFDAGMTNFIPKAAVKNNRMYSDKVTQNRDLIKKQNPNEPTDWADPALVDKQKTEELTGLYGSPGVKQVVAESEAGRLMRLLNKTDLPPHLRQAATSGEILTSSFGGTNARGERTFVGGLTLEDIRGYLSTRTPSEIKNMGVTDVAIKTKELGTLLDAAEKNPEKFVNRLGSKYLARGTETAFPTTNDMKWVELKDKEAIVLDGRIQSLCTKFGVGYTDAVEKGVTKLFSLRNEKNLPYALISVDKDVNGAFTIVSQVKGRGDTVPKQYFNQIDDFLTKYEAKINKPLRLTENDQYLPINRRLMKPARIRDIDENGVVYEREVLPGDPGYPDVEDFNYPVND